MVSKQTSLLSKFKIFIHNIYLIIRSKEKYQRVDGFIITSLWYHLHGKHIYSSKHIKILGLNQLQVNGKLSIGLKFTGFLGRNQCTTIINKGNIISNGSVSIGSGCRIEVGKDAYIKLENCSITAESDFIIFHGLEVGKGTAISWGCSFLDEDFHKIEYEGKKDHSSNEIKIGEHVWIGNNVSILKGVHIGDGSIVASHSVVINSFPEKNLLIGGYPAKILARDVKWG